ncbi:bifunctional (p)ppGpp synthetase/guanosine-3',5'-bis(diphosphate) 3'-pyrophosphohydrolase [Rhodomicrobium sp. Az07]|uniref:RelA/SpoT family protein n=1 Tax=Rhodomicrobium sp. Az07 TaxID=2839034 RepID=UPI001BEB95C8|nr:bifunctional (p)ppGpp synthetase/guanosine-3',5'-bis(diphosphate) 3'-pyrophosphohydrolase [Rhodomicrobium sp. Az07]
MMRQYDLVEKVLSYNPRANEALLNRAYVYAMQAHGQQKRASGDPYFSHPLAVAAILTGLKLDDETIATALLHDTIEDTQATKDEIEKLFGPNIAALVDGLTKIEKLNLVSKKTQQAENFRKLLIAISSDVRVLLVKLADRLHNMRTLEHMKPEKRRLIAQETMDIYAPLAGRMGIQEIRDELEELSFRWLHPAAYETLMSRLNVLREQNRGLTEEIASELRTKLEAQAIKTDVTSREKKPYSIWLKMQNKQIGLEQLSDVYGFRVIVPEVQDCYTALGVVHRTWRVVPGRFKDYISTPKHNDYKSIHTTIVGPRHQRVELQIRTAEMHQIAEYGVAAHSGYKLAALARLQGDEHGAQGPQPSESMAYQWLRKLVDNLLEGDNPEEFLEHTKLELFLDQVFCFTPKGRLIALPRGANGIDFAYAVHTHIGNHCVGVKINGRHMPLLTELKNGDEVEIILSDAQTPPAAWENAVMTGKARSAIRRATREAVRKQYLALGRDIMKAALERADKAPDTELSPILPRFSMKTADDLLAAVGQGEIAADEVLGALDPNFRSDIPPKRRTITRDEAGWFNLGRVAGFKFRWAGLLTGSDRELRSKGVPLKNADGSPIVKLAEGGAVPGERIVGILDPGKGITIYPIHSPKLRAFEDQLDLWIDVTWDIQEGTTELYPARIQVTALNEPGSLARIASVIGAARGNIDKLQMVTRARDYTEMLIDIEVLDLKHLTDIVNGVKNLPVVSSASRVID